MAPETAIWVLQRVRCVFSRAVALGYREANPAVQLHHQLKHRKNNTQNGPFRRRTARIPHALGTYRGKLAARLGMRLLLLILTRTSEVREAKWHEFDLDQARLERAGRSHEGSQRTPCTALHAGRSHPPGATRDFRPGAMHHTHLIVDNYATRKHAKDKAWLASRPRHRSLHHYLRLLDQPGRALVRPHYTTGHPPWFVLQRQGTDPQNQRLRRALRLCCGDPDKGVGDPRQNRTTLLAFPGHNTSQLR